MNGGLNLFRRKIIGGNAGQSDSGMVALSMTGKRNGSTRSGMYPAMRRNEKGDTLDSIGMEREFNRYL